MCPAALQVVVDAFDPSVLVSDCATRVFDFMTMKEKELHDIQIPLDLLVGEWVPPGWAPLNVGVLGVPHWCEAVF
jgi:hypothetical protein